MALTVSAVSKTRRLFIVILPGEYWLQSREQHPHRSVAPRVMEPLAGLLLPKANPVGG
jgi:hypothetical protein